MEYAFESNVLLQFSTHEKTWEYPNQKWNSVSIKRFRRNICSSMIEILV